MTYFTANDIASAFNSALEEELVSTLAGCTLEEAKERLRGHPGGLKIGSLGLFMKDGTKVPTFTLLPNLWDSRVQAMTHRWLELAASQGRFPLIGGIRIRIISEEGETLYSSLTRDTTPKELDPRFVSLFSDPKPRKTENATQAKLEYLLENSEGKYFQLAWKSISDEEAVSKSKWLQANEGEFIPLLEPNKLVQSWLSEPIPSTSHEEQPEADEDLDY